MLVGPCAEPEYEVRDMRSDAAAKDCLDCRSSGREFIKLVGNAAPK